MQIFLLRNLINFHLTTIHIHQATRESSTFQILWVGYKYNKILLSIILTRQSLEGNRIIYFENCHFYRYNFLLYMTTVVILMI